MPSTELLGEAGGVDEQMLPCRAVEDPNGPVGLALVYMNSADGGSVNRQQRQHR
jgi:hypothetical protein